MALDLERVRTRFRTLIADHAGIRAIHRNKTASGYSFPWEDIDRGPLAEWAVRAQRALEDVFPGSDSVHRSALGASGTWGA